MVEPYLSILNDIEINAKQYLKKQMIRRSLKYIIKNKMKNRKKKKIFL